MKMAPIYNAMFCISRHAQIRLEERGIPFPKIEHFTRLTNSKRKKIRKSCPIASEKSLTLKHVYFLMLDYGKYYVYVCDTYDIGKYWVITALVYEDEKTLK